MRALVIAVALLLSSQLHARAYERFPSPDRRFEAYTTPNSADGTGMKLFLRRAGNPEAGVLVLANMRWIDAKWSPDSRFLAVVDHNDGHIADVHVFGVRAAAAAQPQITLYYHTPGLGTYDVQWEVIGWRTAKRQIILRKEVRDQDAGTRTRHRVAARIGKEPLKIETQNET